MLALQGAFSAHQRTLESLGAKTCEVKLAAHLKGLDGLVLPGGESTTMSNLLVSGGLFGDIAEMLATNVPVMGTCAGLILLASEVLDARQDQQSFAAINITVRRNGYGRQVDSFEAHLQVKGLQEDFNGVFIRSPVIEEVGEGVDVLARYNGNPVAVSTKIVLGAVFHPELAHDGRFHQIFIDMVTNRK